LDFGLRRLASFVVFLFAIVLVVCGFALNFQPFPSTVQPPSQANYIALSDFAQKHLDLLSSNKATFKVEVSEHALSYRELGLTLSEIDSIIYSLSVSHSGLNATVQNNKAIRARLKSVLQRRLTSTHKSLGLNLDEIELFYRYFASLSEKDANYKLGSIAPYLNLAIQTDRLSLRHDHNLQMELRKSKREYSKNNPQAVENAILALALLTNTPFLDSVLNFEANPRKNVDFTLSRRSDLAKHFLLSAAIKILTDQGTSTYIGELKELLDSDSGSGFSFKDIAADRAGIEFVKWATNGQTKKQAYQHIATEEDFFPSISHLDEHLDSLQFKKKYKSTTSKAYLDVIENIDNSIASLKLYQ